MRFPARLLCGLIAAACCSAFLSTTALGKTIEIPSQWVDAPLPIDGARADWPERSIQFFVDNEAFIGACNDSANLYLILHFRNPDWARLIRRGGLTVYLDPEGKKGKDFKLQFTGGPTMKEIMALSGRNEADRPGRMPTEGRERREGPDERFENRFLCYQKQYLTEKEIPMDGSEGPAVAGAVDNEFFVYEFRVPLTASTVKTYGLGVQPGRTIGVGLIWGEMDKKRMQGGMRGMGGGGFPGGDGGGMPPGGEDGGMPPGGGPGGGGGRRGGGPMGEAESKKQEVWIKVQLANADAGGGATKK